MTDYATLVRECREQRKNWVISNASLDHAAVLFENLFAAALAIPEGEPQTMVIQSHHAMIPFYSRYLKAAKAVLDRGVKIRVLIVDHTVSIEDNPFLTLVDRHANGEVEILHADADGSIDFVVVGNSVYRLEDNIESIKAVANFNDPVVASLLNAKFEDHWLPSAA